MHYLKPHIMDSTTTRRLNLNSVSPLHLLQNIERVGCISKNRPACEAEQQRCFWRQNKILCVRDWYLCGKTARSLEELAPRKRGTERMGDENPKSWTQ
jgi:hypothetical protein